MRKLAPVRVSYRDDFFISYRVYIMTGSFHISLFEGTLHVDKVHVRFKIADITGRPISHRNGWSFRVYMIPLRDFVPEWNSRPGTRTGVNSRRGDSRGHDILWWYHVNKYRAMRGNRSELAPGRKSPRCHVNTPWFRVTGRKKSTQQYWKVLGVVLSSLFFSEEAMYSTYVWSTKGEARKVFSTATVSGTVYWSYLILPFGIVACTFFRLFSK